MAKPGPKKGKGGVQQKKLGVGRPLTFTDERVVGILEDISQGRSVRGACGVHGVPIRTLMNWLENDKLQEFWQQYAHARGKGEYGYQNTVNEGIINKKIDGGLALEMLSRLYQHWRKTEKQEITGKDGGPIEIQDFSKLTTAQLQAIAKGETPSDL